MTRRTIVEFDPPTLRGPACQACEGRGVSGEQYTFPTGGEQAPLLVDVFCPVCHGCGHATHEGCRDADHPGDLDLDVDPYDDDDEDADVAAPCWSCLGREFNVVTGFPPEPRPEDRVVALRVPCGCTADRAKVVDRP